MGKKGLIASLASAALVLALALGGCGTPAPSGGGGGTVTEDRQYSALNPQGIQPAIDIVALAPRLQGLDGQVIYIDQGEPNAVVMPALYEALSSQYTLTEWRLIGGAGFGPAVPEQEVLDQADAVIRGLAY